MKNLLALTGNIFTFVALRVSTERRFQVEKADFSINLSKNISFSKYFIFPSQTGKNKICEIASRTTSRRRTKETANGKAILFSIVYLLNFRPKFGKKNPAQSLTIYNGQPEHYATQVPYRALEA